MPTLWIEHNIHDYDTWRAAFDRNPAGRKRSGVRRFAIHRPLDDAHYIMIDLDFETVAQAEVFVVLMQGVWRSSQAAPALNGTPVDPHHRDRRRPLDRTGDRHALTVTALRDCPRRRGVAARRADG